MVKYKEEIHQSSQAGSQTPLPDMRLSDFWNIQPEQREEILLQAIKQTHMWHYNRNEAYYHTITARGVDLMIQERDLPRLLRPTAQTFKSYIDILGTPFPQDQPYAFLNWLDTQLSIELPRQRFNDFRPRYKSLEALLSDIEIKFPEYGLELSTSSGTSGRSTIMVRDQSSIDKTVESFYLAFQRYLGMQADHRAIFIMPKHTRIAMARMASFSVKGIGLQEKRVHYTIPFPAYPDQVRIRAGRTFQQGWRGMMEQKLWHPFMNWADENYVMPKTIQQTVSLLEQAESAGDKVLLFGGLVQLHAIALLLQSRGQTIRLAPGSLLGTGGGLKDLYPFRPEQIRHDLTQVIELIDGHPIPLRDVYGMAEGNWAAMQCAEGNYHIPPWIYSIIMDRDDRFQETSNSTGLLAFFDPFGGGNLFPSFFKTADQVTLVNGSRAYDPYLDCACGEAGAYLTQGSIQRVDLLDEAGCAAQL